MVAARRAHRYNYGVLRWLLRCVLILGLTASVGFGTAAACATGGCDDDAARPPAVAVADDAPATAAPAHDGAPDPDPCPPQCPGCRVPADASPRMALTHVTRVEPLPPLLPIEAPLSAPPSHGLFRPPRA